MKDKDGNDVLKKGADGGVEVSSENMRFLLKQILLDAGAKDDEMLVKQMMSISETATASGNYAFGGMTTFDGTLNHGHGGFRITKKAGEKVNYFDKDGKIQEKILERDEQADWAAGKIKNLESQERQRKIHPDSLFTRTVNGFGDLNGAVAEEIIKTFTSADVSQVDRSRDDLKQAIHEAYSKGDPNSQFMKTYNDTKNDIFKQYVDSVVKMKRGFKKDDTGVSNTTEWKAANAPGTKYEGKMVYEGKVVSEKNSAPKEKTQKEKMEEMKNNRKTRGARY